MKRYFMLIGLLVMLWDTEARAANIGFDNPFSPIPDQLSREYQEDFFSVRPNGGNSWMVSGALGDPVRYIFANGGISIGTGILVESTITDPGVALDKPLKMEEFTFTGVTLSGAGGSGTTYHIIGSDASNDNVYSFDHTVTAPFESILVGSSTLDGLVGNPLLSVRRLYITSSNTLFEIKIDEICLNNSPCSFIPPSPPIDPNSNVPEPGSLLLLGAGLAGIGIWRRKATKIEKGV